MRALGCVSAMALLLAACSSGDEAATGASDAQGDTAVMASDTATSQGGGDAQASAVQTSDERIPSIALIEAVTHERRDENRARDEWRHPVETLTPEKPPAV